MHPPSPAGRTHRKESIHCSTGFVPASEVRYEFRGGADCRFPWFLLDCPIMLRPEHPREVRAQSAHFQRGTRASASART